MVKIPFPQSIKNQDWETIIHPAVVMVATAVAKKDEKENENDTEGERESHEMKVPKFWNPPMFAPDVRTYLGNYGERIMTPEEASSIGSYTPAAKDYDVKVGDADVVETVDAEDKEKFDITITLKKGEIPPDEVLMLETIYVSIASYRDYRCPHTLEALFTQAAYPERIRVGIVDQLDPTEDSNCAVPKRSCATYPEDILCKHSHQIDVYEMDAKLAVGPVFARHIGTRMYRGEYFFMQSDAHMEFVNHWDEDAISQWKSARNDMAVLTTYVSEVEGHYNKKTGERDSDSRPIMCESDFENDYYDESLSFLMHGQQPEGEADVVGEPSLHPFWAAGFSFARGHFAVQVPYDQYQPMIFQGEEINVGIRAFTYGYDFYAPEKSVLYHYYHTDPKKAKRKVNRFWEHADSYKGVEKESKARLLGIIEMLGAPVKEEEAGDKDAEEENGKVVEGAENEQNEEGEEEYETIAFTWNDIDAKKYGIGHVRSVQKFLETFGIDLAEKTVEKHLCAFVGEPMNKLFNKYLRSDGMGIDYSQIEFQFKDPKVNGNTWEKYM